MSSIVVEVTTKLADWLCSDGLLDRLEQLYSWWTGDLWSYGWGRQLLSCRYSDSHCVPAEHGGCQNSVCRNRVLYPNITGLHKASGIQNKLH